MSESGSTAKNIFVEISNIVEMLSSKLNALNDDFLQSETQLKAASAEIVRLRSTVDTLKQKHCLKCQKYYDCIMVLKKKLKVRDNTIAILTKVLSKRDEDSYNMASQMVNEVINEKMTPERDTKANADKDSSPIVLKTAGRSKRKLSITDDDERKNEDLVFANNLTKTSEKEESLLNNIVPSDHSRPEILRVEKITKINESNPNGEVNKENVVLTTASTTYDAKSNSVLLEEKKANVSLVFSGNNRNCSASTNEKFKTSFNRDGRNDTTKNEEALKVSPINNNSSSKESGKSKMKWNLKKSRMLSFNDKLKHTVFSTSGKKMNFSTLKDDNGDRVPPLAKQLDIISPKTCSAFTMNMNETFFEPIVTSTVSEPGSIEKSSPGKSGLVKFTNKVQPVRTPVKIDDNFDFVPSASPPYKYKRNAVRKKSERLKLPGQDCDQCFRFYETKKDEMSSSRIQKLLNKCSRHRDKYPVRANTPPGLWNPVFDDTNEGNGSEINSDFV